MGIFSSKKKTFVSTEISRVFKDKDIPDMHQKNIIDSTFKNQGLTKTIINNALDSQTLKLERAYRKAARGDYYYGAPNHNIYNAADGRTVVENILEIKHGTSVLLDYFHFAPLNNLHYAWQVLTEDYGYSDFSNTLMLGETKYWVEDVVGHIDTTAITSDATAEETQELTPDDGTMAVWGRHPQDRYSPHRTTFTKTPVWLFGTGIPDGAMVYLVDEEGNKTTLFIDTNHFDRDLECFQARYRYFENDEYSIGYFTYEYSQGKYPELDAVHNKTAVGKGTFFPILFFRSGDKNMTAEDQHDTEAYKSSVNMANSIGLDYQYLGDTVNENESADDLDQAVLMMGVPAETDDSVEAEYLFRFFDWLYKESTDTTFFDMASFFSASTPGKAISIKERDFNCTLSFKKLVRTHQKSAEQERDTYLCIKDTITKYRYVYRQVGPPDDRETEKVRVSYEVDVLRYRYQVTESTYQEIMVEDLKLRYNIYGNKGVDANVGSDKLLVPLDYYIARSMRYAKKDRLYYRSMHFVFNARVTKTVKWYQTGVFQIVMLIVAVVIIVVTAGAASPLGAALAKGAYLAATLLILKALVVNYLISMAIAKGFEVLIDAVGVELGAILAVVAFIAAAYAGYTSADWADAALQASNGLTRAYQNVVQDVMRDYQVESQEFALLADEKMEELEEIDNLLNSYNLLDPRSFIGKEPKIVLGESPSALYDRTVHTGNIGTLQYDQIESYVALNTQLPTFNDLVGETFV